MGFFFILFRYIRFLVLSGNAHSIHSPFIFDFYTKVVAPEKEYYVFKKIEKLRNKLLKSKKIISITDFGAGSKVNNSHIRRISSIAKHTLKPAKIGQFLFKTILYFKPKYIFELGTSLGITTLYLAKANTTSTVITFEGCPELSEIAANHFEKLQADNIRSIPGNIDLTLIKNIEFFSQTDLVFFDANHRHHSTKDYFKACLSKVNENSIFIFDDIHWSTDMERAWKEIKDDPAVTLSIDFFFLGIVFFRKGQPKQHFILRL